MAGRTFLLNDPDAIHHVLVANHANYSKTPRLTSRRGQRPVRRRPRYAFFPFGGGPRVCIGEPLGRMEGVLLLARIAQRARFELLPDQQVVPDPGLTLTPSPGIRVRVRLE